MHRQDSRNIPRVELVIEEEAIHAIARIAAELNHNVENIGPNSNDASLYFSTTIVLRNVSSHRL